MTSPLSVVCLLFLADLVQQRQCYDHSQFPSMDAYMSKANGANWYAEPDYSPISNDTNLPSPKLYKGIGGYSCKNTDYCKGQARPGSKWDFTCKVSETGEKHFCIPFEVDPSLGEKDRPEVYRAMRWMRENTCIAFVFRKKEADYVKIQKGKGGCSSESLGKSGGMQNVKLGPGCHEYPAVVFHELMHALGFEHIHQRADRDQYININMDNIDPALKQSFKTRPNVAGSNNMTFNYESVLLYGSLDFQKEELKSCNDPKCWTITKKDGGRLLSVYMKQPSVYDYKSINDLYGCDHPDFRKRQAPREGQAPPQPPPPQQEQKSSPPANQAAGQGPQTQVPNQSPAQYPGNQALNPTPAQAPLNPSHPAPAQPQGAPPQYGGGGYGGGEYGGHGPYNGFYGGAPNNGYGGYSGAPQARQAYAQYPGY